MALERANQRGLSFKDRRTRSKAPQTVVEKMRERRRVKASVPEPRSPPPPPADPVKSVAPPVVKRGQIYRPTAKGLRPASFPQEAEGDTIQDLREDTASVLRNSHLSFQDIRARGGPCPSTLNRLITNQTKRPHVQTLRGTLQACGFDLYVAPRKPVKPK
jgi:hypothetical protein